MSSIVNEEPKRKKIKSSLDSEPATPVVVKEETADEWPFENVYEDFCFDLLDPNWPVRHGATLGLCVILKTQNKHINAKNMEDLLIRLLCLLCLDRFGDYVSDQVVAPVRESCGQTLGALFLHLDEETARKAIASLCNMCGNQTWEVRHAGLIGLTYCMAVRDELVNQVLPTSFPLLLQGLKDSDDDVRCVSAECLIPITSKLVPFLKSKKFLSEFLVTLWGSLSALDDLSVSTVHVLSLLEKMLSFDLVIQALSGESMKICDYLALLFPFAKHSNQGVRASVLSTLLCLQSNKSLVIFGERLDLLNDLLKLILEIFLIEDVGNIIELAQKLFDELLSSIHIKASLVQTGLWQKCISWMSIVSRPLDVRDFGDGISALDVRVYGEHTVMYGRICCCIALGKLMAHIEDEQVG